MKYEMCHEQSDRKNVIEKYIPIEMRAPASSNKKIKFGISSVVPVQRFGHFLFRKTSP